MTRPPRRPPNSFHRTHSKFVCVSPPTEFTEFTEISGGGYSPTDFTEYTETSGVEEPPTDFTDAHRNFWWGRASHRLHRCSQIFRCVLPPNLCTSVQSVGVFVGGYGIPAILTPPSEFLPQNPLQVCLRKSSHGIHGIHRNFWRRRASHGFHRIHRSFRRRIFSHRLHRIHRSFWRRIASHRCAQMHTDG